VGPRIREGIGPGQVQMDGMKPVRCINQAALLIISYGTAPSSQQLADGPEKSWRKRQLGSHYVIAPALAGIRDRVIDVR
jgi:hypothetical protein